MISKVADSLTNGFKILDRKGVVNLVSLVAISAIIGLGVYLCLDGKLYGYLAIGGGLIGLGIQAYPESKSSSLKDSCYPYTAAQRARLSRVRSNQNLSKKCHLNPTRYKITQRLESNSFSSTHQKRNVLLIINLEEEQDRLISCNLPERSADVFTVDLPKTSATSSLL